MGYLQAEEARKTLNTDLVNLYNVDQERDENPRAEFFW